MCSYNNYVHYTRLITSLTALKSRLMTSLFRMSSSSHLSHFYVGSMCRMTRLHLTRTCTSSPDNYSDVKLHSIFHIEYKVIEFITNKKEPTITCLVRH